MCYSIHMSFTPFVSSILASTAVVACASVGFFAFLLARDRLAKILSWVVAFAAGSLLGAAFFHLLPEALELRSDVLGWALVGLLVFFAIDALLWVYHCHAGHQLHAHDHEEGESCPPAPIGVLNLVGDALHNMLDGVVIASTFLIGPSVGIIATIGVMLHEIPQEVGDFGILLSSGFKRMKALKWNMLVACTVYIGVILTYAFQTWVEQYQAGLMAATAGGFLYMASANLLSEIKEETSLTKKLGQTVALLLGVLLLFVLREGH